MRYADNAKKIQNKAVINESPQDKIIRELRDENKKLKDIFKKIIAAQKQNVPLDLNALGIEDMEKLEEDMEVNEELLDEKHALQQETDNDSTAFERATVG